MFSATTRAVHRMPLTAYSRTFPMAWAMEPNTEWRLAMRT